MTTQRRKRPTNTRSKKRTSPRGRRAQKAPAKKQYLPALGIAALFCAGIALGAFLISRTYTLHLEAIELREARQWAAERAKQATLREAQQVQARALARTQSPQKAVSSGSKQTPQAAAGAARPTRTTSPTHTEQAPKLAQQTQFTRPPNITPPATEQRETPAVTQDDIVRQPPKKQQRKQPVFSTAQFSSYTPAQSSNIMAIVIDDIGYQRREGLRTLHLPGKLTIAVLPFTPFAQTLAKRAPKLGKEVMLHAPMEPKALQHWGEGLTAVMTETELRNDFVAMINDIPNLIGVNNHMGSGLTENAQVMDWLMAELPQRGLYFIDSRTSAKSAAYTAAKKRGIPTYQRDIFLDNNRDKKAINQQLNRLIRATQKTGMALGIGHPYPETLDVLEQRLPELKALGIELVTVSELLNARSRREAFALGY
ncbi:divergent polysaccharide deacetylase family protein [Marinagarivorans algicola]|uniref:divergent polysaccharide deacetylase family protein n=1 Tax=Marinagarivorans algicola TaxID=1513270 RepID=UPI0006B58F19|nr:divergent polysaccharide deacetylase family protein [Marinagarivorans algicola]